MLTALALALVLAAPPPLPPIPARPGGASARPASDGRLLGEWPSKSSEAKVTLRDGKYTVDKALKKIADAAGWSLIANTGRAGDRMLVVDLRDVPVEDALVAVLEGTPLAATRRGNTVTVAPQALPVVETPVMSGFDAASGKKITASFADVGVDKALRQIAEAAGWSIVLPPGLRGSVNASFKATPVEEALKAVLSQAGLSASRDGSIVNVSRTSGPRVIVRGDRRRVVYDQDGEVVTEDIKGIADEARAAAAEALADAQSELADAQADAGGKKRDKVLSGDVVIGPGERWRDVVALRGNVRMGPGSSARQVTAVLGSVELEPGASVDQEAVAVGGNVHVSTGAHVGKDAVSVGGEVSIDQGGVVDGQEVSVSIPGVASLIGLAAPVEGHAKRISTGFKIGQALAKYVVFFLLGLLLLALAPARLDRVTASLTRSPVRDLLVGVLGTIAMPVLTVLLVVTVVGILLVPVQLIAILVAGILGYTALALLVGRALPIRTEKATSVVQLAVGVALVVLVSEIPYVGFMAMITAWFLVFGAVLRSRGGQPSPAAPSAPAPTTSIAPTTPA